MLNNRRIRIEEQLVKWGFNRCRVQSMNDFYLMSSYNFQVSLHNKLFKQKLNEQKNQADNPSFLADALPGRRMEK